MSRCCNHAIALLFLSGQNHNLKMKNCPKFQDIPHLHSHQEYRNDKENLASLDRKRGKRHNLGVATGTATHQTLKLNVNHEKLLDHYPLDSHHAHASRQICKGRSNRMDNIIHNAQQSISESDAVWRLKLNRLKQSFLHETASLVASTLSPKSDP